MKFHSKFNNTNGKDMHLWRNIKNLYYKLGVHQVEMTQQEKEWGVLTDHRYHQCDTAMKKRNVIL